MPLLTFQSDWVSTSQPSPKVVVDRATIDAGLRFSHRPLIFSGFEAGCHQREGIFSLEEVFNFLGEVRPFGPTWIMLDSQRYHLFAKNHKCVRCGLEGCYFAKERSARRRKVQVPGQSHHMSVWEPVEQDPKKVKNIWHLNLYALQEEWHQEYGFIGYREILMTKDHILPRSKGGANEMWNYNTMCQPCNSNKGSKITTAAATVDRYYGA